MDTATIISDLTNILGELPVSFSFGGTSYSGTRTSLKSEIKFSDYGAANDYAFSVIALASAFAVAPVKGDEITIGATIYRVISTRLDAAGAGIAIDLGGRYA